MSFATGFSLNQNSFVSQLSDFAIANGFTQNQEIPKGTGTLSNLQKTLTSGNVLYASLRSATNETMPSGITTGFINKLTGIGLSISTGYDNTKDFHDQPGSPTDINSSTTYFANLLADVGTIATYWFFGYEDPDLICAVIQLPSGKYKHLAFGDMVKSQAFTGGHFIYTSDGHNALSVSGLPFEHIDNVNTPVANGIMRVDLDSREGWWGCTSSRTGTVYQNDLTGGLAGARFFDNELLNYSRNTFAGLGVLCPIHLWAWFNSALRMRYIGYLDWMRACNLAGFTIGEGFSIGSDDWMVFPSTSVAGSPYGIAYRYIP